MSIGAQQVKELRDQTSAGLMDCKRALVEAEGNMQKARTLLREKGLARAQEKRGRETTEGAIFAYVHHNNRLGALVELACETDFVARNEDFQELGRQMAMQVAAMAPRAIRPEELPEEIVETERQIYRQQCADKPEHIQEKIVEGKLEKFYDQLCLLRQEYIGDESKTVAEYIKEQIATLGENIRVRRFVRMEMGEQ